MRRVAVTGIGIVLPSGNGMDEVWENAVAGRVRLRPIDRFEAARYQCRVAGQADFDPLEHLPGRFVKRTDRFTHLAMATAATALKDAGLSIGSDVAAERTGIMVGNVLGGWEFAERELRRMWLDGARAISPYQATAWFPAAPQGNICIELGIKGRSRTFVADRASGAYALMAGAETIARGHADVVLAGGVEAPLSSYAWLCLQTSGLMAKQRGGSPDEVYRPFGNGHCGSVFGEGSTFLVLEERERALARNAALHGEIVGWAASTDGYLPLYTVEPTGEVLGRAIRTALDRAGLSASGVSGVFAHGSAQPVEDATEVYALRDVFGPSGGVPVSVPKAGFGHTLGAAAPADVALALRALREGVIPPTPRLDRPAPGFDLDFVRGSSRSIDAGGHAVVVSRGLGGVNACLVLSS
ncbi:beta-ketoacyl-[acyl-carrier-protein] synthase family protein [Streptomyces sp. NPDC019443]|uniref:beta-ketoacyl-[acyl-carrier-protein] synthase family protein n=1 Tax=Streptomyces sp. NPDC019443 TaxID=3365061 RepID=UPI0037A8BC7E